jgi:hypothetical protein
VWDFERIERQGIMKDFRYGKHFGVSGESCIAEEGLRQENSFIGWALHFWSIRGRDGSFENVLERRQGAGIRCLQGSALYSSSLGLARFVF